MKSILYGTTALMAVGLMAGTAVAAEKISLGLGGYWRAQVQMGNNESDAAGADSGLRDHGFGQESEIYFSGKTTMDNGIKVGVMVQLEGETSGDQIDNTYIWSSGSFGRIEYGETWGPSLLMSYGSVGEKNHTGDFASFNPQVNLNGLGFNSYGGNAGISGLPTEKLAYYTPRMGGFQVGVSYAPEPKNANANGTRDSDQGTQVGAELVDLGINYSGKFGGATIGAFTSYYTSQSEGGAPTAQVAAVAQSTSTTQTAGGDAIVTLATALVPAAAGAAAAADVDGHSVGAQVSSNGVRVGGRYTRHSDIGGAGLDRVNWRLGADYSTGAWGVGATYQVAEQDVTASTEDSSTYLSVGASYNLSPGVQMYGGVLFVTYDDDAGAAASEGENSFGILGTKLSF